MKKRLSAILAVLLAITCVLCIGFMTSGNRLKASESNGKSKASKQQEEVKKDKKKDKVDVPKKESKKESKKEDKKKESKKESKKEDKKKDSKKDKKEEKQKKEKKVSVKVKVENKGQIYYGDQVKLRATVSGIKDNYKLQWQYNDGKGWKDLNAHGKTYKYTINEKNADYDYRVKVIY